MESFVHTSDSSFANSGFGGYLLKKFYNLFDKLSLKRPSDFFLNGQIVDKGAAAPSFEKEKILMQILDYIDLLVYYKDIRLKYLGYNEKFKNFFKIEKGEIDDKDFLYQLKKHEREVILSKTQSIFDYQYKNRLFHIKIVPIKSNEKLLGVAGILEDRSEFKRKVDELLSLSEYLKNRCLIYEKLSMIDPLTGAYNKQKFKSIINQEIERAKRYKEPLSLILFDIDDFKQINDIYGHLVGDLVLKNIVEIIKDSIRKIDFICRIGGDEFAIIVPNSEVEAAFNLAKKALDKIKDLNIKNLDKKIGCSFGIAQYRYSENFDEFFKRVDKALYQAKNGGKNRISFIK